MATRRLHAAMMALVFLVSCTGHHEKPASRASTTPTLPSKPAVSIPPCGPNNPDARPLHPSRIEMPTANVAWTVEIASDGCMDLPGAILRSVDEGRTWRDVTPSASMDPGFDVAFDGPDHAWVVATVESRTVEVLRTDDGGAHWHRGRPFNLLGDPAGTIHFVDARYGWIVQDLGAAAGSEGIQLLRSSDAGRSWKTVAVTRINGDRPRALPFGCNKGVSFSDASTAWAAGQCAGYPFFMVTRDAGRTWSHAETSLPGVSGPLVDGGAPEGSVGGEVGLPVFSSPSRGVVHLQMYDSKTDGNTRTVICITDDGGRHWRRASLPSGRRPFGSELVDRYDWWLVSADKRPLLYLTDDAGRHWRKVIPGVDLSKYGLNAVSPTVAFAFDLDGRTTSKTVDGGTTWRPVNVPHWPSSQHHLE